MADRRSLLPASAIGAHPGHDAQAPRKAKSGAGLQFDGFNLFVGRMLYYLGIVGNLIEIATSTKAILITFMDNPGSYDPGFWIKAALSLFIALCVQTGMWTLVVNLNDSWINVFEGQLDKAFVSEGEVKRNFVLLYLFEFGGMGINIWWDAVFFNSLVPVGYLVSLGTGVLILSSILFCPLGLKLIRNAKRRIRQAKRVAAALKHQDEVARAQAAVNVTPVPEQRGLVRYQPYQ